MRYAEPVKEFFRWLTLVLGIGITGWILYDWGNTEWQWICLLTNVVIFAHAGVQLHDRWAKKKAVEKAMKDLLEALDQLNETCKSVDG